MEIMLHKQIRARRRFKALIRLVIANRAWLDPGLIPEQLMGNIKKNVQLHTKKRPLKSVLALQHKALLNKPAQDRTEEEKSQLYRIIGGFKCFRKYPEQVKIMLAAHTYFAYYGPDRTIVRQHHRAEALYFIISGEVSVSIETYDPILKENVVTVTGTMTSGSAFGEVSLLNDVPRPSTIISITPVEFLLLKREDFNVVLKDSVRKEWDYIIDALNGFTYFDSWDDLTKTECCLVAKVKNYERGTTILGDGEGLKNWAHLVLKGKCQLIEHLLVESEYRNGVHRFKMYQPNEVAAIEEAVANVKSRQSIPSVGTTSSGPRPSEGGRRSIQSTRKSGYKSLSSTIPAISQIQIEKDSIGSEGQDDGNMLEDYFIPPSVETYFLQVCIFSEKACFGIGENMDRRRVVALTDVECLVIPRYWVLQRGKGNIWLRIQQYLQTHIPTTSELFKKFVSQRKWRAFKRDFIKTKINRQPCNAPQNVPYSIRIEEDFQFQEREKFYAQHRL